MNHVQAVVADIGGTNTRIGVVNDEQLQQSSIKHYSNIGFENFETLLGMYCQEQGIDRCDTACIAVAAPVVDDNITLTNHNWCLTRRGLKDVTGAKNISFLNDFEALALSLDRVDPVNLMHLSKSSQYGVPEGTRLVVGAGTGFNSASVSVNKNSADLIVGVGETGHMTLPVETKMEFELREYLARGRGRASIERALSGAGLVEIYTWLCERAGIPYHGLTAREISERAVVEMDGIFRKTAEILLCFFGRCVGDLALAFLSTGGVYLSGGVTRALKPLLDSELFFKYFLAKGRQSSLLSAIPVYLIDDDAAALAGCTAKAVSLSR